MTPRCFKTFSVALALSFYISGADYVCKSDSFSDSLSSDWDTLGSACSISSGTLIDSYTSVDQPAIGFELCVAIAPSAPTTVVGARMDVTYTENYPAVSLGLGFEDSGEQNFGVEATLVDYDTYLSIELVVDVGQDPTVDFYDLDGIKDRADFLGTTFTFELTISPDDGKVTVSFYDFANNAADLKNIDMGTYPDYAKMGPRAVLGIDSYEGDGFPGAVGELDNFKIVCSGDGSDVDDDDDDDEEECDASGLFGWLNCK